MKLSARASRYLATLGLLTALGCGGGLTTLESTPLTGPEVAREEPTQARSPGVTPSPGWAPPAIAQVISTNWSGQQANGPCANPSLSYDGSFICFTSKATNLGYNVPVNLWQTYRKDLSDSTIDLPSVRKTSTSGWGDSRYCCLSSDGWRVAFQAEGDLGYGPGSGPGGDVYVRDMISSTTRKLNVPPGSSNSTGAASLGSFGGTRYVYFASYAQNLVPGDTDWNQDAFRADLTTNQLARLNVTQSGSPLGSVVDPVCGNQSGNQAVFPSLVSNTATILEKRVDGSLFDWQPGGYSFSSAFNPQSVDLSANGDVMVYTKGNGELWMQKYSQAVHLPVVTPSGYWCQRDSVAVSDDGRYVAFVGHASGSPETRVYVKNLQTVNLNGNVLAVNMPAGVFANSQTRVTISGDGRAIAWSDYDTMVPSSGKIWFVKNPHF